MASIVSSIVRTWDSTQLHLAMIVSLGLGGVIVASRDSPAWLRWAAWSWTAVMAGISVAFLVAGLVVQMD